MSGAGMPRALRRMTAGLGAPVRAKEGLRPREVASAPGLSSSPISGLYCPHLFSSRVTMASLSLPSMVNSHPHLARPKGPSNAIDRILLLETLKQFSFFSCF